MHQNNMGKYSLFLLFTLVLPVSVIHGALKHGDSTGLGGQSKSVALHNSSVALSGKADAGTMIYSPWWSTSEAPRSDRVWSQTKLLFGAGVATAGILYAMPKSVTNWNRDDGIEDLPERWWKNVSRRPVWDKDDWFINYVGHTYCGGVYYQMARKSGFNQWDSFLYTTFMSTFFWEYGIEAFAERPSIQDLIVTPLGGYLYGEWAYHCEQRIEENDNRVLGFRTLGHISRLLLDPIDHLGQGVNYLLGDDWVITGRVALGSQAGKEETQRRLASSGVAPGFRMTLTHTF